MCQLFKLNKMYKISEFENEHGSDDSVSPFMKLLKFEWDNVYKKPNVFRYKINNLQMKLVDGNYILILNPDRGTKRRAPELMGSIHQPFDDKKFNFTKVSSDEILFTIETEGDEHMVLVNVSPMSHYHTLLCPSLKKKLPQVITADGLLLTLQIMFMAQDRNLKIVFNSLCGCASVNHMHYHIFVDKHTWPVEIAKWEHTKGPLHYIPNYPVPAFCFVVQKDSMQENVAEVYRLIEYFLDRSIAHNIVITMRDCGDVSIYVWPRKSVIGVKDFGDMNVAACELAGWITVYSFETFQKLKSKDIETVLKNWKIDNFEVLYKEVQLLY